MFMINVTITRSEIFIKRSWNRFFQALWWSLYHSSEVVLIKIDLLKQFHWLMGGISKVIKSQYGQTLIVKSDLVANGELMETIKSV